jgi:hypothetical protein
MCRKYPTPVTIEMNAKGMAVEEVSWSSRGLKQ